MKIKLSNTLKTKQFLTIRKLAVMTAVSFAIVGLGVVILHLKNPEIAKAATCESSYTLDWSIPSTYTVSCGAVNSSNWTVKGTICYYYSPVFNAGGTTGQPDKAADIAVRINQSGNLDGNDTAWVYMYVNNSIVKTYVCKGDSISAVFTTNQTITVPAGGTYKIVIKLKNDKTNETWQIKNGDVTTCLRSLTPLPISLGSFIAKPDSKGNMQIDWITFTETNNDYFTLEKSSTGNDFKPIARVEGSGNSSSIIKYTYMDDMPFNGKSYYRLKQTDFDGTTYTHHTIAVNNSQTIKNKPSLQLFPNPFTENFSVNFESETTDEVTLKLISLEGKIVYQQQRRVDEGPNTISCIVPAGISKGQYFVQVSNHEKTLGSIKAVLN